MLDVDDDGTVASVALEQGSHGACDVLGVCIIRKEDTREIWMLETLNWHSLPS
jgi:hypothetical protein